MRVGEREDDDDLRGCLGFAIDVVRDGCEVGRERAAVLVEVLDGERMTEDADRDCVGMLLDVLACGLGSALDDERLLLLPEAPATAEAARVVLRDMVSLFS